MGVVYLARDGSGTLVALKVLRPELVEDPTVRRRFEREAAIARRVQGRCIARLIDANLDANVAWLATEWVDGPTLAEHVRAHGPITSDPLCGDFFSAPLGE
jgi:serine/threonine protein kinase